MSVSCGLAIDGLTELQGTLDGLGAQVEEFLYLAGYFAVTHGHTASAVGIHIDVHGLGHTDGIAHLHQHLVGHTGSHEVLGDMTGGVCSRTVYLAGILAAEGSATMGTLASIGVDNNLASGKTRIAMRTADDKLARGVHIILDVIVEQGEHLLGVNLLLNPGNEDVEYIFTDALLHGLIGIELVVLGRHHDGIDTLGNTIVAVLDGHLALGVGAQIGHDLAFLADVGEGAHEQMGEVERYGHVVFGFVGGITEHHALVAGTLVFFRCLVGSLMVDAVDTTIDVVALLMDGTEDAAGVAVKLVFGLGVADILDGIAGDGLQVDVHIAVHLTHDDHLSGGYKTLTSHPGTLVVGEELVEDGIADLVGHLVGMTLRNGF